MLNFVSLCPALTPDAASIEVEKIDMQLLPTGLRHWLSLLSVCLIVSAVSAGAETLTGSNVDSRMMLGFRASAEQVQSRLPDGWTSIPFPTGPLKGANLLVGLEERLFAADVNGKPLALPTSRAIALLGLARKSDGKEIRLYVLRVFSSDPDYNMFKNAIPAKVARSSAVTGDENSGRRHKEEWKADLGDGGTLSVTTTFATGRGSWVSDQARPYSNVDPAVSHIFRYDQLVELAMSIPANKPLTGNFHLSTSIPALTGLFDGSQQLLAIMNIPVYVRNVFIP